MRALLTSQKPVPKHDQPDTRTERENFKYTVGVKIIVYRTSLYSSKIKYYFYMRSSANRLRFLAKLWRRNFLTLTRHLVMRCMVSMLRTSTHGFRYNNPLSLRNFIVHHSATPNVCFLLRLVCCYHLDSYAQSMHYMHHASILMQLV